MRQTSACRSRVGVRGEERYDMKEGNEGRKSGWWGGAGAVAGCWGAKIRIAGGSKVGVGAGGLSQTI